MRANQSTISHETHPEQALEAAAPTPKPALHQRAGVRQLVKFCLVGASSTIIDKGTGYAMMLAGKTLAPGVPWWIWTSISFCLGVSNGYFWNRRWTFQATGESHSSAGEQYRKFVLTNAVGYALNQGFTKLFLIGITGQVAHAQNPAPHLVTLASLCAVPIVVIWNFCAAKFWTFKPVK